MWHPIRCDVKHVAMSSHGIERGFVRGAISFGFALVRKTRNVFWEREGREEKGGRGGEMSFALILAR